MMRCGDMVIMEPGPRKFMKALATVANVLHPAYDRVLPLTGKSKESCVLCSLTVRDFLLRSGFKDACVTTVYLMLVAVDADGKEVHSAGCGDHNAKRVPTLVPGPVWKPGYWNGHMVVEVPSQKAIIDTTLAPMRRKQWPLLPGMLVVPIFEGPPSFGMEHISAITIDQRDGITLRAWWVREPNESWRTAGDATDEELRAPVVRALRSAFRRA